MNLEQLTRRIKEVDNKTPYTGSLTPYVVQSIELGRSNYTVQNFILYCQGRHCKLVMTDLATLDRFYPNSVLEVHEVLNLLMDRYLIDNYMIYRRTGVHYTTPKSYDPAELERMAKDGVVSKYPASLSIRTLLAVCEAIHCDLSLEY